ncbi:unnamed protein product, partial [Trichobilharzia regenti]
IFDIFDNPNKPKYHFKPVDGSFCDATFIHLPQSALDHQNMKKQQHINHDDNNDNENDYNVGFATMKLGPDCLSSLGPFFLAESLEWDVASLNKSNTTSDDDFGLIPELTRDRLTGVLGGGGVSLQYISSLGLLLHAYQSGHSVASGIDLFNTMNASSSSQSQDENKLCITHSFLLATGPRETNVSSGTAGSLAKLLRFAHRFVI